MKTVGDRIKARRAELGLTQADVATLAGIKPPSLHDIESGRTKRPAGDTLVKLAKILKTTPEQLQSGRQTDSRGAIARAIDQIPDQDLPKVQAMLNRLIRQASPKK